MTEKHPGNKDPEIYTIPGGWGDIRDEGALPPGYVGVGPEYTEEGVPSSAQDNNNATVDPGGGAEWTYPPGPKGVSDETE